MRRGWLRASESTAAGQRHVLGVEAGADWTGTLGAEWAEWEVHPMVGVREQETAVRGWGQQAASDAQLSVLSEQFPDESEWRREVDDLFMRRQEQEELDRRWDMIRNH